MKIIFIYPNICLANRIPVGIAYLSACLKRDGHQVSIFDTTFLTPGGVKFRKYSTISDDEVRARTLQVKDTHLDIIDIDPQPVDIYEKFTAMLDEIKPDLVAMSCHQNTYLFGIEILKIAKEQGYKTIVGGVKATTVPEEVIAESCVDMLCIGEGEVALARLCQKLQKQEDISTINNLWIKKDSSVLKNAIEAPTDLNSLPAPDWSIFDRRHLIRPMGGKVYRMGFFELSRGCPYGCSYCINKKLLSLYKTKGKFSRFHNIEKSITEIKSYKQEYGFTYISFNDDLFLEMSIERLRYFCEEYKKEINLPFYIETRPETITEERIDMLVEAGLNCMSMGIESGNPYIRAKVLNRHTSNEAIIKSFLTVKKTGIRVTTNNIIGMPYETRKEIFETIEINRKIRVNSATVKYLYPYQGTAIYELCKEKGFIRDDVAVFGYQMGSILKLPQITNEELEGLHNTFQLYCYLPKIFFPVIRIAEKETFWGKKMFTILSVILKVVKSGKE